MCFKNDSSDVYEACSKSSRLFQFFIYSACPQAIETYYPRSILLLGFDTFANDVSTVESNSGKDVLELLLAPLAANFLLVRLS